MDIETIEQKPMSISEVKEKLESIKKDKKELNFRATKVYEYTNDAAPKKKKEVDELYKKIEELNIPRLRDRQIIKIIDIMPEDVEVLKTVLSGEGVTLKAEDLTKIFEMIKA